MSRTALAALAFGIGLAGLAGVADAEGEPPRVVLVQTAGVGAERQTTIISSNNPTPHAVPSQGALTAGRQPEAVLGDRASRPAPVVGTAGGSLAGAAAPAPARAAPALRETAPPAATPETAPAGLPPAQLTCVQGALGRAFQSGLISREQPSIGEVQIGWLAGQCSLDPAELAPILARALGEARPAGAARPSDQPPSAEPTQRPSWQRSILDDADAPSRERVERMRAANRPPAAQPRTLPLWQLGLLGLTGLAGLAGALYGLTWLARPRYVVRVIPPPGRRAASRPSPPLGRARPSGT